jgi:hypothetical protein
MAGDCDPGSSTDVLPIAQCHLDVPQLREQADRYRRLGATIQRLERRDGALTAVFGDAVDERLLTETIEVERGCCPFFAFDYEPEDRRLSVTVEQPDQRPALDALHYALAGRD